MCMLVCGGAGQSEFPKRCTACIQHSLLIAADKWTAFLNAKQLRLSPLLLLLCASIAVQIAALGLGEIDFFPTLNLNDSINIRKAGLLD